MVHNGRIAASPDTVAAALRVNHLDYLIEDQRLMSLARNYFEWQGRLARPHLGARVIEIGCGTGNFTGQLLDREAIAAIDVEQACIGVLQSRYAGHSRLQAFTCDLADPKFNELASFRPDACVCLNVLEHIGDDRRALSDMASILAPGGVIVLLVPAFRSLLGSIDRKLGHFRRYRARDVRELAASAGLRIRILRYINCIGFFGWWVNSRLLSLEKHAAWQLLLFDRCIVPWLSRLESLVHPPFGQSIFAVLEKPGE